MKLITQRAIRKFDIGYDNLLTFHANTGVFKIEYLNLHKKSQMVKGKNEYKGYVDVTRSWLVAVNHRNPYK